MVKIADSVHKPDYRFKKFGGEIISDVVAYILLYIKKHPNLTISVGCDSIQRRKKTTFALTISLYQNDLNNGAHVIFKRFSIPKIRDTFERLQKEAFSAFELAEYLNDNLKNEYIRTDLNLTELKKYSLHVKNPTDVFDTTKKYFLSNEEMHRNFKLVDIHLDFNPIENPQNKSNLAYKSFVPWLRGMEYRVFTKPLAYSASSAADLLLKD